MKDFVKRLSAATRRSFGTEALVYWMAALTAGLVAVGYSELFTWCAALPRGRRQWHPAGDGRP